MTDDIPAKRIREIREGAAYVAGAQRMSPLQTRLYIDEVERNYREGYNNIGGPFV